MSLSPYRIPFWWPSRVEEGTFVEIVMLHAAPARSSPTPYRVYETGLSQRTFDTLLSRAVRHRGYTPKAVDAWVTTLAGCEGNVNVVDVISPHPAEEKTLGYETKLVDETSIAPLVLVRRFDRTRVPLSHLPCAQAPVWQARVRRLELRVHEGARLVFECLRPTLYDRGGDEFRRVRIELEVNHTKTQAHADIARTIENTVQVVFLGQTPRRKGASAFRGGGRGCGGGEVVTG